VAPAASRAQRPAASLYVHIPFCDVRCPYCHFYCFVSRDPHLPLRYVRALARELALRRETVVSLGGLESVYFGGGTPSALPPDARAEACRWLAEDVAPLLRPGAELTLEANPESAWPETLRPWVDAGINRISLGVQSMDQQVLTFLGRLNTPRSNLRALDLACRLVENVSADLILATPVGDWARTEASLAALAAVPITHVSGYLLEIHAETRFGRDAAAGRLLPRPDDDQAEIYLRAVDWLTQRGFAAYELSNFGQPGCESRHNQRYWKRLPYFGLGASAHSFHGERRWENHRDAVRYCDQLEQGAAPVAWTEELSSRQRRLEELLLGLRMAEGIAWGAVAGREMLLAAWAAEGLVVRRGGRLAATPKGWLVLDRIVAQLGPP
jgi:oxygen-independent coproporphyrinogen-3 oxidase